MLNWISQRWMRGDRPSSPKGSTLTQFNHRRELSVLRTSAILSLVHTSALASEQGKRDLAGDW